MNPLPLPQHAHATAARAFLVFARRVLPSHPELARLLMKDAEAQLVAMIEAMPAEKRGPA